MTEDSRFDAVVVGAGFAGLYMLHRLREAGFSVRVLDAGGGVGGTWYWNRYPGCRCDVESMQYSFSFDPELEQEWEWTERFATQPEILRYLEHVADRFELWPDIQLETRVLAASYDESADRWLVETDRSDRISAQFLILATGCLSTWQVPDLPGLGDFAGAVHHTANWPHEGVDFAGKRVAVIGTGSSGIQAIPLIAEQARHLTVFQRTPTFTVPARNRPLDPELQREVKANYRALRQKARESPPGFWFDMPTTSALAVDNEERLRRYEERWRQGGIMLLLSYDDLLRDLEANATLAEFVRGKIREIVRDEATAERLVPRGFPIGAKRLCVDSDYYATFNRDDVTLVDVSETPIVAITRTGVRTTAREHELDALVLATGFDAGTGAVMRIDIRGRGGAPLREKWAAGPSTYLGVQSAGFPNLFLVAGAGSPSALTNVVAAIEQHVEWLGELLEQARERGIASVEATEEAEAGWDAEVREAAAETVYPHANSWYLGANVPGKPRVFMFYTRGLGRYRELCDDVAAKGYEGFALREAVSA
jgi:cyclohexanone monooxygenase